MTILQNQVIDRINKLLKDLNNLQLEIAKEGWNATNEQLAEYQTLRVNCAYDIIKMVKESK